MKTINWQDIGNGWQAATIKLDDGETAPNPASTYGPIYGPCVVTYRRAPSGSIKVEVTV